MNRMLLYLKLIVLILMALHTAQLKAYSVLTHEAIIDINWDKQIQPLLLDKFPGATQEQLQDAQAYAYGGCLIPDMGYYPFGCKFFTDLLHYVRTGDLIDTMLANANDINEYAFALGVLCHYYADKYGHPIAVNRSVPLLYPDDAMKYGHTVTYEQDPLAHVRTEFGFDVLQTARGNYASKNYHAFIGFKVSRSLLEKCFVRVYGIEMKDVYKDLGLSIETFRWVVKRFFPRITRVAWSAKKDEIRKTQPTITRKRFEYKMRRANYNHEFGRRREHPGIIANILAITVRMLPKRGALQYLKIEVPKADEEKLFIQSFDTVSAHYGSAIAQIHTHRHHLINIDYDTGNETKHGEYSLADNTYNTLLQKLKDNHFRKTDKALQHNILTFYYNGKTNSEQTKHFSSALDSLKTLRFE